MTTTGVQVAGVRSVRILGVPVHCASMDEALAIVEGFVASGKPHLIFTADSSSLVVARSNPEFRHLIEGADLVTIDSAGVFWAAKRKCADVKERVSGVDLLDKICALSANKGYRLFFLGAEQGIAELAAEKLRLRHPGCNIVGTRHGYFPAESDEIVAREIAECKPDILFVAMGMPRQEKFIRSTESIIKAKVGIGVGGSLDVYSGKAKRAPAWCQRYGVEWLWRLILDPSKIAKVKVLPKFMLLALLDRK